MIIGIRLSNYDKTGCSTRIFFNGKLPYVATSAATASIKTICNMRVLIIQDRGFFKLSLSKVLSVQLALRILILNFFWRRNIDAFWMNHLTCVQALHVHSKAITSAAPRHPYPLYLFFSVWPGADHYTTPCVPPCLCQSSLSPLPFVRVILSSTTQCGAVRCGGYHVLHADASA